MFPFGRRTPTGLQARPAPCPSEEPHPPWDGILAKYFASSLLSGLENTGVTLSLALPI